MCNIAVVKIELVNYYSGLRDFFDRTGYIVIPALGTIVLSKNSSEILNEGDSIQGSSAKLIFTQGQSKNFEYQIQYFSRLWDFSKVETNSLFHKFGISLLEEISKSGKSELPGFGFFSISNNDILFNSSNEIELTYNYFNRNVPLVKKFRIRKSDIKKKNTEFKEDKLIAIHPKYWRSAAAILLAIVTLFIGFTLVESGKSIMNPVSYQIESSDYSPDDFNRKPESDGYENNQDKVLIIDSIFDLEDDTTDAYTEIEEPKTKSKDSQGSNTELFNDNDLNDNVNSKSEESCIYITGSFTTTENVERMITKLKSKNFEVYKAPYNGNIRVGVMVPCDDSSVLKTLESIEKEYWLLEN